jgi:MFS family permease
VAEDNSKPTTLAGYVGLFTGCGALVALSLFLPLPTRFGDLKDVTKAHAVKYSFYVVGACSLAVAIFVGIGLQNLRGEEGKGWRMLLGLRNANPDGTGAVDGEVPKKNVVPYWHLLRESVVLGFIDSEIAIGYLGGFVARASTVALSLFIPLFVSSFFIREGLCRGDPSEVLSKECKTAYNLAAALTGVAQLIGLLCAPLFGYLSSRLGNSNVPLIIATTFGIAGYIAFPKLQSPEFKDKDGRGGSPVVFLLAALIGISQIGAIVCSLGSLGRGVLKADIVNVLVNQAGEEEGLVIERPDRASETAPLLERPEVVPEDTVSRVRLKGSVAGVYSWCGGAAILLLTKLGGYLFDSWTTGAPFYLMAAFNGLLLVAVLAIDVTKAVKSRSS